MTAEEWPSSWTDPQYVATVVGIVAIGALYFYAALASPTLTAEEVSLVVLAVSLPATIAYEIARRWKS